MSDMMNGNLELMAIEGAKKVRGVARTFLVIGIINIVVGILVMALGWPLGIFSAILGIMELINANTYWSTPPKKNSNPSYIGILEIINIICGPFWSVIAGISNLNALKSPETKAFFAMLGSNADKSFLFSQKPSQLKKCPNCAENIQLEALACRYCGYKFNEADVQQAKNASETNAKKIEYQLKLKSQQGKIKVRSFWGWLLFVLGILFTFLVLTMILVYTFNPASRTTNGKPWELPAFLSSVVMITIIFILPTVLGGYLLLKKAKTIKKELTQMEVPTNI